MFSPEISGQKSTSQQAKATTSIIVIGSMIDIDSVA
jgi:hypothetical protein